MNIFKKIKIMAVILSLLFFVIPAQAQISGGLGENIKGQIQAGAGESEIPDDPQVLVIKIINIFLGLMATVFIVLVLLSGYWFLTARGEPDMIKKGKDTLKRAILGLVIVLLAYSIAYFIGKELTKVILE